MSLFGCCGSKKHVRTIEKRNTKSVLGNLHSAIVAVTLGNDGKEQSGLLLSTSLVMTTHGTVPSRALAEHGHVTLYQTAAGQQGTDPTKKYGKTKTRRKLLPKRFFLTNRALDVTILACEDAVADGVSTLNLDVNHGSYEGDDLLDVGNMVYVLGHTDDAMGHDAVTMGESMVAGEEFESSVVILCDSSRGQKVFSQGSAGFDNKGDFSFLVSRPEEVVGDGTIIQKVDRATQSGTRISAIANWLLAHGVKNLDSLPTDLPQTGVTKPPANLSPARDSLSLKHVPIAATSPPATLHLSKDHLVNQTPPPGSAESSTKTVPRFHEDVYHIERFSSSSLGEEEELVHSTIEDGTSTDNVAVLSEPQTNSDAATTQKHISDSEALKFKGRLGEEIVADNTEQLRWMQAAASSTKESLPEGGESDVTPPSSPPVATLEEQTMPESPAFMVDITNTMREGGIRSLKDANGTGQIQAAKTASPRVQIATAGAGFPTTADRGVRKSNTDCGSPLSSFAADSVKGILAGSPPAPRPPCSPQQKAAPPTPPSPTPSPTPHKTAQNASEVQPDSVLLEAKFGTQESSEESSTTWYSAPTTPQISPVKSGAYVLGQGDAEVSSHHVSPTPTHTPTQPPALPPQELKNRIQGYGNMSRAPKSTTPPRGSPGLIGTLLHANVATSTKGVPHSPPVSPGHSPTPKPGQLASQSPAVLSPPQPQPPTAPQPHPKPAPGTENQPELMLPLPQRRNQSLPAPDCKDDAGRSASTSSAVRNKIEGYGNVSRVMLPAQTRGSRGLSLATPLNLVVDLGKDLRDVVTDIRATAVSGAAALGLAPRKPEVDEHGVPLEQIRAMVQKAKEEDDRRKRSEAYKSASKELFLGRRKTNRSGTAAMDDSGTGMPPCTADNSKEDQRGSRGKDGSEVGVGDVAKGYGTTFVIGNQKIHPAIEPDEKQVH